MKNKIILLLLLYNSIITYAQVYQYGQITYERRTNLLKRFSKINWMKEWLEEDKESKIRTEQFNLYFNDTISALIPQASENTDWMEWTTSKNKVYTNFKNKTRITFKDIFGEMFVLKDSLSERKWKYTGKQRKIAGYDCLQLVWQENDSSRIYAYVSIQIDKQVGPESFNGLPGAILGLATEDGGIIYFAKSISFNTPESNVFKIPKYKKAISTKELYNQLNSEKKKSKWDKLTIELNFGGLN